MRLALFIDGGYLDKILRNELGGAAIEYGQIAHHVMSYISSDIDLLRTYYYHCLPYRSSSPTREENERYNKQRGFYDSLDRLSCFEVRLGRLDRRGPDGSGKYRFEQKLVDVLLSVDMVALSATRMVTHAALIAGDSDFCPAIELAKSNGVSFWLFHGRSAHDQLWRLADSRIEINQEFIAPIVRADK